MIPRPIFVKDQGVFMRSLEISIIVTKYIAEPDGRPEKTIADANTADDRECNEKYTRDG